MSTEVAWQPKIREPFIYFRGVEEVVPRVRGWTDEGIKEWCDEIVDFVPSVSRSMDFPALSSTTILEEGQDRQTTTFRMRHAELADPEILRNAPDSLFNLVANYAGIVPVAAYDVARELAGEGVRPIPLGDDNYRRVEAFVIDPENGESGDWHTDERLTLPLYLQQDQALLVSHLTNPRNVGDILSAPMTLVEPDFGQFLAFDGVRHPHKGLTKSGFTGDRVVLGVLYDLPGIGTVGPQLDDLIRAT